MTYKELLEDLKESHDIAVEFDYSKEKRYIIISTEKYLNNDGNVENAFMITNSNEGFLGWCAPKEDFCKEYFLNSDGNKIYAK